MKGNPILTEEHYAVALLNGIDRRTLQRRIKERGWDLDKAINTPKKPTRKKKRKGWEAKALSNGINIKRYQQRIQRGWSPEKAASVLPKKQARRTDQKWIRIAKTNGIPYPTYLARVNKHFWSAEEAATTPVLNQEEVTKRATIARKEIDQIIQHKTFTDPNNLFTVTKLHIEQAALNEIPKGTVYERVYKLGWTVDEAITVPVMKRMVKTDEYLSFLQMANRNGISEDNFKSRIKRGWGMEEASRRPLNDSRVSKNKHWMDIAEQNGIRPNTFNARLRRGWSLNEAATKPVLSSGEYLNDHRKNKVIEKFKEFNKRQG
ncbi:hypothetical protein [Bacillus sp. AG4(2022)]|uniref:hypothetical protein n=1 Tax=Bacillus sp. AG4(2022) TaxID=2962594 RepID=UPI00288188AA|nr:hypothetical protein [Bacillus sp. AG4(2022)]MDT0163834.1 hypothetical protein [Bacillus sp. AG4(2022)]